MIISVMKRPVEALHRHPFRQWRYCPHCGHTEIYTFKDGKRYRCAKCKQDFTSRPARCLAKASCRCEMVIAIYLLSTTSKGMSSVQVAKHVGVTQKTAWFMAHRIREAHQQTRDNFFGKIEADELSSAGCQRTCTPSSARQRYAALAARTRLRCSE